MNTSASPETDMPRPLPGPKPGSHGAEMTMMDHLAELRRRLLVCIVTLVVCMGAAFFASLPAIQLLKLLAPATVHFVQISPGEVFMASFRVSVFLGVTLALPVVLYQVLRFVMPGLSPKERVLLNWVVLGGGLLFFLGVVFAYYLVIPPALEWLIDYGQEVAESQMSIARFVEFCSALLLLTGVMFELPMVLFLLSFTRLVTSQKLIAQWRWATVAIFVASAIITPSQDPLSMTFVGLAMVILYLLSIIPIRLCGR